MASFSLGHDVLDCLTIFKAYYLENVGKPTSVALFFSPLTCKYRAVVHYFISQEVSFEKEQRVNGDEVKYRSYSLVLLQHQEKLKGTSQDSVNRSD